MAPPIAPPLSKRVIQKSKKITKSINQKKNNKKEKPKKGLLLNIQGLISKQSNHKVEHLRDITKDNDHLFLGLTESHLSVNILDAEIQIDGYNISRCDRAKRSHGGVLMYSHENYVCNSVLTHSTDDCEILVNEFPELMMVVAIVYRPPGCSLAHFECQLADLSILLRKYEDRNEGWLLTVIGDFNFPSVTEWGNFDSNLIYSIESEKKSSVLLNQLSCEHQLIQIVDQPTRINNMLDLVFCNDVTLVDNVVISVNSKLSDHNSVIFDLCHKNLEDQYSDETTAKKPHDLGTLKFDTSDIETWNKVEKYIHDINWNEKLDSTDTNSAYNIFEKELNNALYAYLPKKKGNKESFEDNDEVADNITKPSKRKKPIPQEVKTLFRRKSKKSKRIMESINSDDIVRLRKELDSIESEIKAHYVVWRTKEEEKLIKNINSDSRAFHKYLDSKKRTSTQIGPLKDPVTNKFTNNKADLCNLLSSQYSSVFSQPRPIFSRRYDYFYQSPDEGPFIDTLEFTDNEVLSALNELKVNAAGGPDGLPAMSLKRLGPVIAPPLTTILNKSFNEGCFPDALKSAVIIPIFKGKSKSSAANYRPISLTSNIAKTIERAVRKKLVAFLESNNLLNNNQHGFRAHRSCLSQLLNHYEDMLSALEENSNYDSIYLDYSKAFDKVDHGILGHKLIKSRITGNACKWLESFCRGRKQKVKIDNSTSNEAEVTSGVPQGTVLGPLLFLILINDINEDIDADINVSLFADDTRVGKIIKTSEDVENLQDNLEKIYKWQMNNNMVFNEDKFELLRVGKNSLIKEESNYFTDEYKEMIEPKSEVKDLGIIIQDDLNFSNQINKITKKMKMKSSWILRSLTSRTPSIMSRVWKTYMLPDIDYCSILWFSPARPQLIIELENGQNRFLKRLENQWDSNYWARLSISNLQSIQRRLERYQIIYIWKAMEGLVPPCGISIHHHTYKGRLSVIPPLSKASVKTKSIRDNTIRVAGSRIFNSIPSKLRNLTGCEITVFKANLDRFLEKVPDEPKTVTLTPRAVNLTTGRPSNSLPDMISHCKDLLKEEFNSVISQ